MSILMAFINITRVLVSIMVFKARWKKNNNNFVS